MIGRVGRDQQQEQQIDRVAVDGVKLDRPGQPDEEAEKLAEAFDAGMRQGEAGPEAG